MAGAKADDTLLHGGSDSPRFEFRPPRHARRLQKQQAALAALSDIGILNDPVSMALTALLLGSPGLALGAIAGALIWRRRRLIGGALGALAGLGIWLLGWLYFSGNL